MALGLVSVMESEMA
jgi:hypothetical protein